MFSSLLKMIGVSPSSSEAVSNSTAVEQAALAEAMSFAAIAKTSPYPFVRILGELVGSEPYTFFMLVVGFLFALYLLGRWIRHSFHRGLPRIRLQQFFQEIGKFFISWPMVSIIFLGISSIASVILRAPKNLHSILRLLLFSVILFTLYRAVYRETKIYFRKSVIYPSSKGILPKSHNLRLLAYRLIQALWIVVFISILLGLWGMGVGSILAGLGIIGVVAGLALQDAVSHVVGGVSLMLDGTYAVGDVIRLENGTEGAIHEIGLRSTKIRTWDEEIVSVPNGNLSKMIIINLSQPIERKRVRLMFSIDAATTNPDEVSQMLHKSVEGINTILDNPAPSVALIEMKGNALIFRLIFYVEAISVKIPTSDIVLRKVSSLLQDHGIRLLGEERIIHYVDRK